MDINIFVEGKHDREFLEQYLKYLKIFNFKIICCNGCSMNENEISLLEEFIDNNEKVVLIFDADLDFNATLRKHIVSCKDLLKGDDIFLFPNNKDKGELETLLCNIAKYKNIFNCFEKYKQCIQSCCKKDGQLGSSSFCKINKKSARYAYFEALGISLSENSKAKKDREDSYTKIFDFGSSYLDPLKKFLVNKSDIT